MDQPSSTNPTKAKDWPSAPVSVVILTFNEAADLPRALDSCVWCDDVHLLDSGSTDETVRIAEERGVMVHHHAFESFGKQRNWAIDQIPCRHDWTFHLDADEQFTPELVAEMARVLANDPAADGFLVPHKLMLADRWLKRCGGYPVYQTRLFHKSRLRFSDHGHGQREAENSRVDRLGEPYLHYAYTKGLSDWLAKHNRYSTLEAEQVLLHGGDEFRFRDLVALDRIRRRRAIKSLAYRLPGRPTLRWIWIMVVQRGLLDGRAGWTYASMIRVYEQMIQLKIQGARREVFTIRVPANEPPS